MEWRTVAALTLSVALMTPACRQDLSLDEATETLVGPDGGVAYSADGRVTLSVPAGALSELTRVTVEPLATKPQGAVSRLYRFGPDGLGFAVPVTLRLRLEPGANRVPAASRLFALASVVGDAPVLLADGAYDAATGEAEAGLLHFSVYGVFDFGCDAAPGGCLEICPAAVPLAASDTPCLCEGAVAGAASIVGPEAVGCSCRAGVGVECPAQCTPGVDGDALCAGSVGDGYVCWEGQCLAVPDAQVQIQLTWDDATNDQDLHLVAIDHDPALCTVTWDCYWRNRTPEWYAAAAAEVGPNPHMDIDDTNGLGPENINIDAMGVDRYRIFVHYYQGFSGAAPTRNTVKVYVDGALVLDASRTLTDGHVWAVATISRAAGASPSIEEYPSDAADQVGAVATMAKCDTPFVFP
ncbi:MAG: hypothetical protein HY903_00800 [Deltaproteobacteria bacterium]|nr:hypothetical protein [Deltaproteobacteria bacterium]